VVTPEIWWFQRSMVEPNPSQEQGRTRAKRHSPSHRAIRPVEAAGWERPPPKASSKQRSDPPRCLLSGGLLCTCTLATFASERAWPRFHVSWLFTVYQFTHRYLCRRRRACAVENAASAVRVNVRMRGGSGNMTEGDGASRGRAMPCLEWCGRRRWGSTGGWSAAASAPTTLAPTRTSCSARTAASRRGCPPRRRRRRRRRRRPRPGLVPWGVSARWGCWGGRGMVGC